MSQDALTVVNGSGLNVRNAFNLAIKAINSDFAGATDPATMVPSNAFAYMMWADTQNELIKQRNADNSAWITLGKLDTDGTIKWDISKLNMAGTLGGALHQPTPISLATVSGVLELPEEGNSFNVSGTEDITSITGWSAGRFVIKWDGARTIKNNSNIAITISTDRSVLAGDISEFEFTGAGQVREINYLSSYAGATNIPQVGVPDNIVDGMTISSGTGLQAVVGTGRAIISETAVNFDVFTNTITLSPRMAALIYAKLDKTIGKVEAKLPIDMIDNNTIGFWDFTNSDTVSATPNSAVGISSIAVANNIVWTNPTPGTSLKKVDGHCGYAIQGDGSTGCGVSQNSTGFPLGSTANPFSIKWLGSFNNLPTTGLHPLFMYGTYSGNTCLILRTITTGRLYINNWSTDYDTGFDVEVGKKYDFELCVDGTTIVLYVNGVKIYSLTLTLSLSMGLLYLFKDTAGNFSYTSIDYIEIRNKIRTPAQIAQISNDLLLPCTYQSGGSIIPQMTSNTSSSICNVSATNEYSTYLAYKAVDGVLGVNGCIMLGSSNQIWTIDFLGISKNIKKVTLMPTTTEVTRYPKNFTIEGWNGVSWVVAGSYVSITDWAINVQKDFYLSLAGNYTKYRVNITSNNGDATYTEIGYIQMESSEITTTDIRSILPADSIALGYAKTNSTNVIEVDEKYNKGRIEGATGGNRILTSEWKYSTGTTYFDNPFTTTVRVDVYIKTTVDSMTWIKVPSAGVSVTPWKINLTSTGTGYVLIIAEVIE